MKLATLKDGSRDGQLLVVSRDARSAVIADGIAPNLRRVVDDWAFHAPQLAELYQRLNRGEARHAFAFEPRDCMAPFPRVHRRISVHPGAAGTAMTERAGDDLTGPHDPLYCPPHAGRADLDAGIALIVDALPRGASAAQALEAVQLVMLAGDVVLDHEGGAAPAWHGGLFDERPASAFAALALSVDELGPGWRDGRPHCRLVPLRDGRAQVQAGVAAGATWDMGDLLAEVARARPVCTGTLVILHGGLDASRASATGLRDDTGVNSATDTSTDTKTATATATATAMTSAAQRLGCDALDDQGRSIFGPIDLTLTAALA